MQRQIFLDAFFCYVKKTLLLSSQAFTVGENSIATIKMRNKFLLPFKNGNGLFSIAPNLVITLPTLR